MIPRKSGFPAGPAAVGWTNPQVFPIGQKVREILLLILFLSKSFLLITLWHDSTSCSACFLLCQLAVTFSLIYRDDWFSHFFHTIRNIQLKKKQNNPRHPLEKYSFLALTHVVLISNHVRNFSRTIPILRSDFFSIYFLRNTLTLRSDFFSIYF